MLWLHFIEDGTGTYRGSYCPGSCSPVANGFGASQLQLVLLRLELQGCKVLCSLARVILGCCYGI